MLGNEIVDIIVDELIIPNPEYQRAEQDESLRYRDIRENYYCVELDGDELIMARGYALQLKLLLREYGIRVRWVDKRKWRRGPQLGKEEFSYFPHQPAAVDAIKHHQQGIYKAPTGSGKTVTTCGFIWERHPMMSLILVDRINLVDQWMKRISTHVGIQREEIGHIGDGKWNEARVTVATVQSIVSAIKRGAVDESWFEMWDVVMLDECHHVTAETFDDVIQRFPARYRFGVSATPDKTGVFDLALNALGEVFYETTHEELRELGLLVEPHVEIIPTDFEFVYWGDHKATKKGECDVPHCKSRKPYHRHRNNYHQLKKALIADADRNVTIVNKLIDNSDNIQLVITDSTEQIDRLHQEITAALIGVPIHVLTGKQTRKKRDIIISEIEESMEPCIILSTIAGEALDIPIIDRVHLVWPTRNPRKTEQNIGRGTRDHDNKDDTIIFDYVDWNVSVLAGQFRSRRWKCYEPLGLEVVVPDGAEGIERADGMRVRKGGGLGRLARI